MRLLLIRHTNYVFNMHTTHSIDENDNKSLIVKILFLSLISESLILKVNITNYFCIKFIIKVTKGIHKNEIYTHICTRVRICEKVILLSSFGWLVGWLVGVCVT